VLVALVLLEDLSHPVGRMIDDHGGGSGSEFRERRLRSFLTCHIITA
jgi:hypothetical protein